MDSNRPLLEVTSLAKSYGGRTGLAGIDLAVGAGEFVVLLGPNGAGKTTLFNILCGLLPPDAGEVRIGGGRPGDAGARRALGIVFQQPTLDLDLSVRANLRFHGALYGMGGRMLESRMEEELARAGLVEAGRQVCRTLSGGNRRKVELARALLHEPTVLLMDEATAGLDHASRRALVEDVRRLANRRGVGVLWATHLVDEASEADRIVVLHEGRVLSDAAPAEFTFRTGKPTVDAAFLAITKAGAPRESTI
ncbi:ATP-binding cassette domain-containing protein [Chelativorans sp. YIM 93263]|uniref:ATP-binding cassette domain-containing protein n=1 Tax=Chelativorans sp. YIM 93263 TaxID=2906648 RepID=UPI0023780D91|nr:ATP-binding cassette domain-containing protein [Chelativorans sp. YIM 93263]